MEMMIMALIALAAALIVRRKEAFAVRWKPDRHTWIAIGTALLAFALSASLLLLDYDGMPARLILYVGIYVVCGFAIPWGYALLVEKAPLSEMGLTRRRWITSLVINLVLGIMLSAIILSEADLSAIDAGVFARGTFVLMMGNLFELFLYYGFVHIRLERAFGVLPAILITSLLYVTWHTGTQLPHEPDLLWGIVKLFAVGVMFQAVFSLTRNLLIIWPFFLTAGVLIDYVVNLEEVAGTATHYPWPWLTLALMAGLGVAIALASRRDARATP